MQSRENSQKNKLVIEGIVERGSGDGRKLGFPTANVKILKELNIPIGVYACRVKFYDQLLDAVLHFGPRLVFGEEKVLFEVHIFDFEEDLYDELIKVDIYDFIRPTKNFDSLDELVEEIYSDIKKAKEILKD